MLDRYIAQNQGEESFELGEPRVALGAHAAAGSAQALYLRPPSGRARHCRRAWSRRNRDERVVKDGRASCCPCGGMRGNQWEQSVGKTNVVGAAGKNSIYGRTAVGKINDLLGWGSFEQ